MDHLGSERRHQVGRTTISSWCSFHYRINFRRKFKASITTLFNPPCSVVSDFTEVTGCDNLERERDITTTEEEQRQRE